MPKRQIVAPRTQPDAGADAGPLEQAFHAVRQELQLPTDYPEPAVAEAQRAVEAVRLPERDETALPFFTIDPPESKDLDQAMLLERAGEGYRVRYAIADVPAFVQPGGALDAETRRRGQTLYLPDLRIPLHPEVVSEGAASLLPGEVRPAFVWDIALDARGEVTSAEVYRAQVRSQDRFDYDQVQQAIDGGSAPERVALLKEIGDKRIVLERERGGASLPMPEQEITRDGDSYTLSFRPVLPSEDWNSQISLLTGMVAAEMMLHAQIGILRTMPAADQEALQRFHRQAAALGVPWPAEQPYGEFLRTLDRSDPRHLALIHAATTLFRGAGYTPFDGDVPDQPEQAAVAAPYAHVTAPLRRLVDRFGLAICEALSRDAEVPEWVKQALPTLPEIMQRTDQLAGKVERACADATEAAVLSSHVGESVAASVVEKREKGVLLQLKDFAVVQECPGDAELGADVQAVVVSADIAARKVVLRLA
ncbi:RNB domain-containing ribonuclease [Luteipulveratus flavus]|uniref:RNB domain-containing ribonuclease n=1 Tax=Luteipulveratus flavus TaxID=3031728 RepID=A0ABT6C391_9MICO|nr:RNB domain-containing ribonuclease [Luteipulveratus sp. YIM 133296]MDF8263433.1 RNB domain-containing ribonuclease [Luteipulveratus sp. YIM 133296]